MPFKSLHFTGNRRYWTKERVTAALASASAELEGVLPSSDAEYSHVKNGRLDWPSCLRIYEYFHSMAAAWLAAGADAKRVKKYYWTPEEDAYLLDYAGISTLQQIGNHLERTYQSVRARLGSKGFGIKARHNQGYLSAAELSKEYNCPCHRIRKALIEGKIKGRFDRRRNMWKINPLDIMTSPTAQEILNRPKRTHKNSPTDVGDYYHRYGIKRIFFNGKLMLIRGVV